LPITRIRAQSARPTGEIDSNEGEISMNKWMAVMVILLLTGVLAADVVAGSVRGYYRQDGTYVQPHQRTNPDGNLLNHYRFPRNYHPNTGKITPGDPRRALDGFGTYPNPFQVTPDR
jgi:hypothetical protein